MASQIHPLSAAPAAPALASADAAGQSVNKETFLKLLVAQIRHQNPLAPADGIQFLTQLAQFSELEQLISMRQALEAIRDAAAASAPAGTPAS